MCKKGTSDALCQKQVDACQFKVERTDFTTFAPYGIDEEGKALTAQITQVIKVIKVIKGPRLSQRRSLRQLR